MLRDEREGGGGFGISLPGYAGNTRLPTLSLPYQDTIDYNTMADGRVFGHGLANNGWVPVK